MRTVKNKVMVIPSEMLSNSAKWDLIRILLVFAGGFTFIYLFHQGITKGGSIYFVSSIIALFISFIFSAASFGSGEVERWIFLNKSRFTDKIDCTILDIDIENKEFTAINSVNGEVINGVSYSKLYIIEELEEPYTTEPYATAFILRGKHIGVVGEYKAGLNDVKLYIPKEWWEKRQERGEASVVLDRVLGKISV